MAAAIGKPAPRGPAGNQIHPVDGSELPWDYDLPGRGQLNYGGLNREPPDSAQGSGDPWSAKGRVAHSTCKSLKSLSRRRIVQNAQRANDQQKKPYQSPAVPKLDNVKNGGGFEAVKEDSFNRPERSPKNGKRGNNRGKKRNGLKNESDPKTGDINAQSKQNSAGDPLSPAAVPAHTPPSPVKTNVEDEQTSDRPHPLHRFNFPDALKSSWNKVVQGGVPLWGDPTNPTAARNADPNDSHNTHAKDSAGPWDSPRCSEHTFHSVADSAKATDTEFHSVAGHSVVGSEKVPNEEHESVEPRVNAGNAQQQEPDESVQSAENAQEVKTPQGKDISIESIDGTAHTELNTIDETQVSTIHQHISQDGNPVTSQKSGTILESPAASSDDSVEIIVSDEEAERNKDGGLTAAKQLCDWTGTWVPPPIDDSWLGRGRTEDKRKDKHAMSRAYAEKHALTTEAPEIVVDVQDPLFQSGHSLDATTKEPEFEEQRAWRRSASGQLWRSQEADKTTTDHIQQYCGSTLGIEQPDHLTPTVNGRGRNVAAKPDLQMLRRIPNYNVERVRLEHAEQVADIVNHHIRSADNVPWTLPWSLESTRNQIATAKAYRCPFLLVTRDPPHQASVLGWARFQAYQPSDPAYDYTVELDVWARVENQRQGIGSTLLQAVLAMVDDPKMMKLSKTGFSRPVKLILCHVAYTTKDQEFFWQKRWLEAHGFQECGNIPCLALKSGRS